MQEGKVRVGYWQFAFLGQESLWAAEASECAADQDSFWDYHDVLFEDQSGENKKTFTKDNLKKLAIELGLDAEAFDQCLDSGKYSDLVQQQNNFARQIGVQSTPSFLINGQTLVGAQPFESFQQVIEGLLEQ